MATALVEQVLASRNPKTTSGYPLSLGMIQIGEAARRLGVAQWRLTRMAAAGDIPAYKAGRFLMVRLDDMPAVQAKVKELGIDKLDAGELAAVGA